MITARKSNVGFVYLTNYLFLVYSVTGGKYLDNGVADFEPLRSSSAELVLALFSILVVCDCLICLTIF